MRGIILRMRGVKDGRSYVLLGMVCKKNVFLLKMVIQCGCLLVIQ